MKKKRFVLLMCIIMSFLLCACGKAQDVEESQSLESTVENQEAAFAKVNFSDVTIEACMDEMISAAVESEFLTDGRDVSIEISEIKDESIDSEKLCEQFETVVIAAVEENKVEAMWRNFMGGLCSL